MITSIGRSTPGVPPSIERTVPPPPAGLARGGRHPHGGIRPARGWRNSASGRVDRVRPGLPRARSAPSTAPEGLHRSAPLGLHDRHLPPTDKSPAGPHHVGYAAQASTL